MSNIFFVSDTHFSHHRCAELRGFASSEEMNELLVANWNDRVKGGDRVYHLGDVSLGKPEPTATLLGRLNGQIFLVLGNHDKTAEHKLCSSRFVWLKDYFYLKVGDQKIALLHYAMRTWRNSHRNSWHLYGHSHGSLPEDPHALSFDVGVDCWGMRPASYDEVAEKMRTKEFRAVDHHVMREERTA